MLLKNSTNIIVFSVVFILLLSTVLLVTHATFVKGLDAVDEFPQAVKLPHHFPFDLEQEAFSQYDIVDGLDRERHMLHIMYHGTIDGDERVTLVIDVLYHETLDSGFSEEEANITLNSNVPARYEEQQDGQFMHLNWHDPTNQTSYSMTLTTENGRTAQFFSKDDVIEIGESFRYTLRLGSLTQ